MWDTWNVTWMNKDFEEERAEGKYTGNLKVLMNTPFVLCNTCMIFPAKAERKWISPRNVPSLGKKSVIKSHHVLRRCSKKIKHLRQVERQGKAWRQGCRKGKMSASWKWDLHTWEEEMKVSTLNPWFVVCGPERFGV